jgi:hypothetical protein
MIIGDVSPNRQQPAHAEGGGRDEHAERSARPPPTPHEQHAERDPIPLADLVVDVLRSMPQWSRWARRSGS